MKYRLIVATASVVAVAATEALDDATYAAVIAPALWRFPQLGQFRAAIRIGGLDQACARWPTDHTGAERPVMPTGNNCRSHDDRIHVGRNETWPLNLPVPESWTG
jgi:hypothetical protein